MSKKMEKGTENAIFLDGRGYTAADLYRLIGLLVGNGVYANELAPTATNEDMSITHGAGHAWIRGVAYWNTTPFVLEIATADGSLNRYDSLMLRLNLSINEVYAVIVQGAYATNPTPPACTRNAETFDLKLCDIYVPAGCTKITQDQITDTRLDSSVCGVPVFPVEHLDMTSFYRQIATDLANFQQRNEADFTAWVEDQKDTNLATMAALVEIVRNTSDDSKAEILDLLAQLNNLVNADTVGELILAINNTQKAVDQVADTRARLFSCTFKAAGWAAAPGGGYAQTVACPGVTVNTQTARPFILPDLENPDADEANEEALGMIAGGETQDGSIMLHCREDAPPVDLKIYFLGVETDG